MNKAYYTEYFHLERRHWWFRARLEILAAMVGKHRPGGTQPLRILNAGIATGATTTMLENFGEVISLEYDEECCAFVRAELGIEVVNASLTELPFEDGTFDVICAFDVIEHIEDDLLALREIYRCLRPGGKVFLTVPAFEALWSEHDVVNHHFRRYTRRPFVNLQQRAGLSIEFSSYFNSILFAPIAAVRGLGRLLNGRAEATTEAERGAAKSDFERFNTEGVSNRVLYQVFRREKGLLTKSISLPFGVSIITVATR